MFLHIGENSIISRADVILILPYISSKQINEFSNVSVVPCGDNEIKSLILAGSGQKLFLYLSPISAATIKKRAESAMGFICHGK